MKKNFILMIALLLFALTVNAQEKGVDSQTKTIRDAGSGSQTPNKGLQSGINWGKDKSPERIPVPNPYRFTARREALVEASQEILRDSGIVLNDAASKPAEGILITQPYTFAKGAELAQSALVSYAFEDTRFARNWTRGRYTLVIEIQPIDGTHCNVIVVAKVEGKGESAAGGEWKTLKSSGKAEEEFLSDLIEYIVGEKPNPAKP